MLSNKEQKPSHTLDQGESHGGQTQGLIATRRNVISTIGSNFSASAVGKSWGVMRLNFDRGVNFGLFANQI